MPMKGLTPKDIKKSLELKGKNCFKAVAGLGNHGRRDSLQRLLGASGPVSTNRNVRARPGVGGPSQYGIRAWSGLH